jgi:8-oxo-dGTP pyrophosphatase MutT (NUDIX family)
MTQAIVHELAEGLSIQAVRPMPRLPGWLEAEIDALWEAAQARTGGRLFNGRVFCADVITPRLICGHWSEYRRVVAQMARHDLFTWLGQRSLAVGGVVCGPDGVVFGRRPARAVYQAGEWQLPPAGTVDGHAARPVGGVVGSVDVLATLHAELEEELGLLRADVRNPRPLCLVEHAVPGPGGGRGSHVLDLGIALETDLDATALRARHAAGGDDEYAGLEIVKLSELGGFLAREAATMNVQAPIFLRRAGLL